MLIRVFLNESFVFAWSGTELEFERYGREFSAGILKLIDRERFGCEGIPEPDRIKLFTTEIVKRLAWDENCDDKATQFGVLHWLVRSKQVSGTLFSERDWDFNIAVDDPDDFNTRKFFGGPAASGLN